MRRTAHVLGAAVLVVAGLAGCSSDSGDTAPTTTEVVTTEAIAPIRVLVSNDDGYAADGIDAVVQGLRGLEGVEVTVVAPATNQSGAGGKTTGGTLTATDVTTKSGYPAKAVQGYPADSIIWALDQGGIDFIPDVVISGINAGQNMGPVIDASGTVGAARAAAQRSIPALAASQGGIAPPQDFPAGVEQVLAWFDANRSAIADHSLSAATVANLNVPTCAAGSVREQITVPLATDSAGYDDPPDCESTVADPADDIKAYLVGFAPLTAISPTPASPTP